MMTRIRMITAAFLAAASLALPACSGGGAAQVTASTVQPGQTIPLTVTTAAGARTFKVKIARTVEDQAKGLMYRTDIARDGGMLFTPYPAEGGPPREASFWMKNTPTPLDIVFIRSDGTIATIAENTVPFSETPVPSGEPVSAVLEILGGRSAELGIAEGDRVSWAK